MTESVDGRAAFQVVLPYRQTPEGLQYALFRRSGAAYWQGVAGGGEVDVTGEFTWGSDVLVIPEYAFGARVEESELTLSQEHTEQEHTEYGWFTLADAAKAVQWNSNRTALWELDHRLRHGPV